MKFPLKVLFKLMICLSILGVGSFAYSNINCSALLSSSQREMTEEQKFEEATKSIVHTEVFRHDTSTEIAQSTAVATAGEVLPWYRRLKLPFVRKKSAEEKYFLESMEYWAPIFESIEKRTGSRIDLSLFKSYRIRNHRVDFKHWVSFDVVPFFNAEGVREFYFFSGESPSGKNLNQRLITEVRHKEGGTVYQHKGRAYGRLQDLDIFKLQNGLSTKVSMDGIKFEYSRDMNHNHLREADGPRAIVLPLSKSQSLKIVDSGRENEVSAVARDNTRWFTEHKEDEEALKLYNDWRSRRAERDKEQVLDRLYDYHTVEISDLVEEMNSPNLTTLEVEAIIIKLQLKIREISRLQSVTMSDWMSEPVKTLLRRGQYLSPSTVGINRALDEVTSMLTFKTAYLYKLNELFSYFDNAVESIKDNFTQKQVEGSYQNVLAEGFKNDLNSEVREAVRLTVEAAYLLERSRLDQLQSLVQRLALTSSTLSEVDLREINTHLEKLLLKSEGSEGGIPKDLDIEIPVLEFDFWLQYKREHSGSLWV